MMGNDGMVKISKHMVISTITLGLLEDTGWYKVNYCQADYLWWGKNQGCDFVKSGKCPTKSGEFCSKKMKHSIGCNI